VSIRTALPWVLLVVLAAALVFVLSDYRLFQLTTVIVYAVAVLGLALVTGFNGQISLGHGAFYAVGAYVTAILMSTYDVPYWATLVPSALLCGVIGFLVGLPALRLGGLYLALTTFGLAVATPQLLKYHLLEDWTGGVQGIVVLKPDAPGGMPLDPDQWLYLFSLGVGTVMFVLVANLVRGRVGLAMRAIRDYPLAAEATGIDVPQFKTRTFAASAMVTGVAGSLGAIVVGFVSPDSFTLFLSITLFVGLVVGGQATIAGPIFGGLFIAFLPNVAEQVSKAAPGAIYGVVLIAFMLLLPSGIAGGLGRLRLFARQRPS
jgi:branched-chain amino acid transport system permease protein